MDSKVVIFFCFASIFSSGVQSSTFTLKNNCPTTVWPGTLTGGGGAQLSITGVELSPQATVGIDVPSPWSGRIWTRSGCSVDSTGKFLCQTGDCGSGQVECNGAGGNPPATLAEFTLGGFNGQDFYDISLVDGFNVPISITPEFGTGSCSAVACPADVNAQCPPELAVPQPGSGFVIGCKSACLAFNQDQFCCTGAFGSPATCQPSSYSNFFKQLCPQAFSYAFDDSTSTFTCGGGPSYLITFCP